MGERLHITLAQLDLIVGDVGGNAARVIATAERARDELGSDLIVFPELTLSGYPPEDLLFHGGFRRRMAEALEQVAAASAGIAILVGYPEYCEEGIYNAAAVFLDGRQIGNYRKFHLPNYGVFDEKRYFLQHDEACVFELRGFALGVTICEDIWRPGPAEKSAAAGAVAILNMNASPFDTEKARTRERVVLRRAAAAGVPLLYVNLVGGQDELVFDGGSLVADAAGELVFRAPAMAEGLFETGLRRERGVVVPEHGPIAAHVDGDQAVYDALVLGVRGYVAKNGFDGVLVGLSGGIDSALTLAIAVDALGAQRVRAVMMPSRYTAAISLEDAEREARWLGVRYEVISIESVFEATLHALSEQFAGLEADATEENIQARCRGMILMALSNKSGDMLLTTGNKSEMAVGYATLYGDMAGGFAPIKDCSKLQVYRLARHRNLRGAAIPERVITRPPSAELRPDQKDSDSLPDYAVLDPILAAFVEEDQSVDDIVARGFDREVVVRILEMVRRNEYKRRQAPPGVRISRRAFGRDWRYPITSGYRA